MKTNPALSLATIFTTLLVIGEALVAQQSESKPADKPFHLTHYDKRIPADSWMLVSMDFDAFLSSKEFLKAAFENSDFEDAPPKAVIDLLTSDKIKIVFPYPMIFGVGGDPDKPGNSPDKNPALMEFLKQRHQFGLYLNLSQLPDELVTSMYPEDATNGNVKLTEAQALELFRGIKQMLPPAHFGMNFNKGEFNLMGTIHGDNMAEKWSGNGLPKTLLNAIPASSMVVLGVSLNIDEANEDIRARLGQFLKIADVLQKIDSPNGQPSLELEQIEAQLNAMTREAVGMDAEDLLKIFHGDVVMGIGMDSVNNDGVGAPEPRIVIGATIKDEVKLTTLLDALEAKGILANPMFKVVRRPGHLFICTPNLARQLKRGDLDRPIAGTARKVLQDNHLSLFADMQKIMKAQAQTGQNWFDQDDPKSTAMFEQMDSMILTARFEEGKVNQKFAFRFRDPKLDSFGFFLKLGASQQARIIPRGFPLAEQDQESEEREPGTEAEAPKGVVAPDQLEEREDISYFEGSPYTGVAVKKNRRGGNWQEFTYKDGKKDGLWTRWHPNGRLRSKRIYKDGKLDGLVTVWLENGQKSSEVTWKDGKKISEKYWDGEQAGPIANPKPSDAPKITYSFTPEESKQWAKWEANPKPYGGLEALAKIREAKESGATKLNLRDTPMTDLTPLAELTKLDEVRLTNNQITDITPLVRSTKLKMLWLGDNHIVDVTSLAGLTNLEKLYLAENKISDLSPLAGLTNLTHLFLAENKISDLSPLAGFTKLTHLFLSDNNEITDFTPVAGLTNLTRLHLYGNRITKEQAAMLKKALPNCTIHFAAGKTNKALMGLSVGMTKAQVYQLAGTAAKVEGYDWGSVWFYKTASGGGVGGLFDGNKDDNFTPVVFDNSNRVTGYGSKFYNLKPKRPLPRLRSPAPPRP